MTKVASAVAKRRAELRRLLRNYVRRHRYSAHAIKQSLGCYVYGECWDMSYELGLEIRHLFPRLALRMLRGNGLQAALGRGADSRYGAAGHVAKAAHALQHHVLEWRGLILDPSGAQFGFRTAYSHDAFTRRWQAVSYQSWSQVEATARAEANEGVHIGAGHDGRRH